MENKEIKVIVGLNEQKMPEQLVWSAEGQPEKVAKAMLLSLFDKNTRETVRIDLWTTDMQVVEMDRFFFQTLRALADTYQRATGNTPLANDMQLFAQHFGEKTEILAPKK